MIEVTNKEDYTTEAKRRELALLLANIINPLSLREAPYMPNGSSDCWSIDPSGNDWWLSFDNAFADRFRITYRYEQPKAEDGVESDFFSAETALKNWLRVILGVK